MELEERNHKNSVYGQFRSSIDLAMGVLYMIISGYAMKTKFILELYGKTVVWILASLFILYGLFRIYRGLQFYKNRWQ
jgi:hypothetical protein